MSRLRVLYVNAAASRLDPGPRVHALEVAEALREQGAYVQFFPPLEPARPVDEATQGEGGGPLKRILRRLLPREVAAFARGVYRSIVWLPRALRAVRSADADVILARHYDYEWLPWLLGRLAGRNVVLEVNTPFYLERRLHKRRSSVLLRWSEGVQWRRVHAAYVVSAELRRVLVEDHGLAPDAVVVAPNGVRWSEYTPARFPEGAGDEMRVIFVGGFYPWHGAVDLVIAVSLARARGANLRLVLVGDGPDRAQVLDTIAETKLAPYVDVLGRVARRECARLMSQAHIGVAPYPMLESFYFSPLKLMEYMAAGLVVIGSAQGQIRDVVKHDENGLLYPPGDLNALADAMLSAAAEPKRASRLGNAARAAAESTLGWDRVGHVLHGCLTAASMKRGR